MQNAKTAQNRRYRFFFFIPILIAVVVVAWTHFNSTQSFELTGIGMWRDFGQEKLSETLESLEEKVSNGIEAQEGIAFSYPQCDGVSGLIERGGSSDYRQYAGIPGLIEHWTFQNPPARSPNSEHLTAEQAISTFSIDVDTASYSTVRRTLNDGYLPQPGAVRVEELINYHRYNYPEPPKHRPVSISTDLGPCPWSEGHHLLRVGLQAKSPPESTEKARNFVFLIDVSGSMTAEYKLPLLKLGLNELVETLTEEDHIGIVTYAGTAGVTLKPTSGSNKRAIKNAIARLESGGSTNGSAGILRAYELARENFASDSVNRVILASDGDFNTGLNDHDDLIRLIESQRASGIYLNVLGFGGDELNHHLMEQLADHGNGIYAYVDSIEEARKTLIEKASSSFIPVADDVKVQIEFDPEQVLSWRQVGYENRQLATEDFEDDRKDAGELGAGHQVTALYEVKLRPGPRLFLPVGKVDVRYKEPGERASKTFSELFFLFGEPTPDFWLVASLAEFALYLQGDPRADLGRTEESLEKAKGSALGDFPEILQMAITDSQTGILLR